MASTLTSPFVSTFLSHSGDDDIVARVATELGRRGVLAWYDKDELGLGPLDKALKSAVQRQATMTFFLSKKSVKSAWCKDELRHALEAKEGHDHLFPVFLGEPLDLVRQHELLRSRFLHPDGDRVSCFGPYHQDNPDTPDPLAVADKLATAIYGRTIPRPWHEVVIFVDQRGNGPRTGTPELPENIQSVGSPVLTFRPDRGMGKPRDLLFGAAWDEVTKTLLDALGKALGTPRGPTRKVRILGQAQASLFWVLGRHFDHSTTVDLYVTGKHQEVFTNAGQPRNGPLPGGNPHRARRIPGPQDRQPIVGLGVGSYGPEQIYLNRAKEALAGAPLFWLEHGDIGDSAEAMKLVKDLVASVSRLRSEVAATTIKLFWTTANAVVPLAAANLTSHLGVTLAWMEWDFDKREYVELPMPL